MWLVLVSNGQAGELTWHRPGHEETVVDQENQQSPPRRYGVSHNRPTILASYYCAVSTELRENTPSSAGFAIEILKVMELNRIGAGRSSSSFWVLDDLTKSEVSSTVSRLLDRDDGGSSVREM